jgi:hypothetical protein
MSIQPRLGVLRILAWLVKGWRACWRPAKKANQAEKAWGEVTSRFQVLS